MFVWVICLWSIGVGLLAVVGVGCVGHCCGSFSSFFVTSRRNGEVVVGKVKRGKNVKSRGIGRGEREERKEEWAIPKLKLSFSPFSALESDVSCASTKSYKALSLCIDLNAATESLALQTGS